MGRPRAGLTGFWSRARRVQGGAGGGSPFTSRATFLDEQVQGPAGACRQEVVVGVMAPDQAAHGVQSGQVPKGDLLASGQWAPEALEEGVPQSGVLAPGACSEVDEVLNGGRRAVPLEVDQREAAVLPGPQPVPRPSLGSPELSSI